MLEDVLELYQTNIKQQMQEADKLHIFANAITEFGLDMHQVLRTNVTNEKFSKTNYLQDMQNMFGGNRNLEWTDLAKYASFIEGVIMGGYQTFYEDKQRFHTVERSQEMLISEMKAQPATAEEYARQSSVFEMFMNEKYNPSLIKTRSESLREELKNLEILKKRVEEEEKDRFTIIKLLDKAPRDVQELVKSILNSSSKYLNLKDLRSKLEA